MAERLRSTDSFTLSPFSKAAPFGGKRKKFVFSSCQTTDRCPSLVSVIVRQCLQTVRAGRPNHAIPSCLDWVQSKSLTFLSLFGLNDEEGSAVWALKPFFFKDEVDSHPFIFAHISFVHI